MAWTQGLCGCCHLGVSGRNHAGLRVDPISTDRVRTQTPQRSRSHDDAAKEGLGPGPTDTLMLDSGPPEYGFPGGAGGKEAVCQSLVAWMVTNPPAMQEAWVQSLGREDPLEEEMATHSSTLPWRIPMDRGAWRAPVRVIAKSRTRLKRLREYIRTPE